MIISCGEALIDMKPEVTEAGNACFRHLAGGAVFNTAVALGRLGTPSAFFSGLSTDIFGQILAETLIESSVDLSRCAWSGRPTTLAFLKMVDGHATYAFYDENTAGRMLSLGALPTLTPDANALFFGGISLVNDPAASTYESLQKQAAATRVTMIDPNFRAAFVDAQDALSPGTRDRYMARVERMMALADIVKLADEEITKVFGEVDHAAFARNLLGKGPKIVLITEGSKGARAITARHDRFVAATPVIVADTVGAGDTFNAGVLTALHRANLLTKAALADISAEALDAALTLGTRAAAVTVSRAGANPPWAHEL